MRLNCAGSSWVWPCTQARTPLPLKVEVGTRSGVGWEGEGVQRETRVLCRPAALQAPLPRTQPGPQQ